MNKEYYDAIDAEMATLENPTVENAIDAMLRKGNEAYFYAFSHYLKLHKIE